ncbi:hypothetical protein ACYPKM_35305 [Pseudomonas aeruginosa]
MSALAMYARRVKTAYETLTRQVLELRESSMDADLRADANRSNIGRCGAECSAAKKSAQAETIISRVLAAKRRGLDITPTVALRLSERLLGRGVNMHVLLEHLATPGRTAADRSALTADSPELQALEQDLRSELENLGEAMKSVIEANKTQYRAAIDKG